MDTSIRIEQTINDQLSLLSEKYRMSKSDVISYLVDITIKYDLIEPDWKDKIRGQVVTEITNATNDDEKLNRMVSLEKIRTINKARLSAFQEYLKVLEPEKKKDFLERLLGMTVNENWLDQVSSYQLIRVNGEARLYQLDQEGTPILNIKADFIEACENGFHVKGQFCKCTLWRDCTIRSEEYIKYKAKTDPMSRLPNYK